MSSHVWQNFTQKINIYTGFPKESGATFGNIASVYEEI